MFDRDNVNLRFMNIAPRVIEKDEKEIPLVEITCEINPFTKELAGELDEFVKSSLFTRTDAEVNSKLAGVTFRLPIMPQSIVVRMAPDQKKESFTIDEAKIGELHARRTKRSAMWKLVFSVTCSPVSEHQLSQIFDAYRKGRFLTFANASPDLFQEEDKERKKGRRSAPVGDDPAEPATAH